MQTKEPVTFTAACIIEHDYLYIASKPDALTQEEDFTRLFFFDGQNTATPWLHHDLPGWSIISVCVVPASSPRTYAALSRNGELEFRWPGGSRKESIPQAGLKRNELPIYGYVNALRAIDGTLYVCGAGGQIYRRDLNGEWVSIAPSLLLPAAPSSMTTHHFTDITGNSANDLYVVGWESEIHHFNGSGWRACQTSSNAILTAACCEPDGTVWACGFNGTVLRGNAAQGFSILPTPDEGMIFTSVTLFNNIAYLASDKGLFFFNETSQKVESVATGLQPALTDTTIVVSNAEALWVIGYKDIASFDGTKWDRLVHPDHADAGNA